MLLLLYYVPDYPCIISISFGDEIWSIETTTVLSASSYLWVGLASMLVTHLLAFKSISLHLCSSLKSMLEVCKLFLTNCLAKWLHYIILAGDPRRRLQSGNKKEYVSFPLALSSTFGSSSRRIRLFLWSDKIVGWL